MKTKWLIRGIGFLGVINTLTDTYLVITQGVQIIVSSI